MNNHKTCFKEDSKFPFFILSIKYSLELEFDHVILKDNLTSEHHFLANQPKIKFQLSIVVAVPLFPIAEKAREKKSLK